ncbi:MAG: hypothetical protein ACI9K2_006771 [Myxococcota bacterium]
MFDRLFERFPALNLQIDHARLLCGLVGPEDRFLTDALLQVLVDQALAAGLGTGSQFADQHNFVRDERRDLDGLIPSAANGAPWVEAYLRTLNKLRWHCHGSEWFEEWLTRWGRGLEVTPAIEAMLAAGVPMAEDRSAGVLQSFQAKLSTYTSSALVPLVTLPRFDGPPRRVIY